MLVMSRSYVPTYRRRHLVRRVRVRARTADRARYRGGRPAVR